MEQKYSLKDIILEAMEKFEVGDEYEIKQNEEVVIPDRIRKQFETYVKNTRNQEGKTLWEASEDHEYKDANKKLCHFFTEKEKNEIIYSNEIHDYLIARSNSEKIKNLPKRKELQEKIAEAKEEWQKAQEEAGFFPEPYTGTIPSGTDVMTEKNMIMFTALFELFFNPIDEKLLSDDIFNSSYYGGDTETMASMESRLRRMDLHNYYTPRKEISEELNIILDALADKIADRLKNNTFKKH